MNQFNTIPQSDSSKDMMAYISVGIGAITLCAWIIPICGCPLSIVGLVLGYLGLQSNQRTFAYVGIGLCALTLLAAIVNAILGSAIALNN
jgi:hypothetical protein